MAVEKMYFVNIAGPKKALDEFVINTIIPHEIQLVSAFSILDSVKGLSPFNENNPYEEVFKKLDELRTKGGLAFSVGDSDEGRFVNVSEIEALINRFDGELLNFKQRKDELEEIQSVKRQIMKQLIPIQNLDVEVDKLFDFDHMKFRFGKMPSDAFERLTKYISNLDVIAYELFREEDEVFLIYFMPGLIKENIDSLFASLFFSRIRISQEVKGYPKEALQTISQELAEIDVEIKEIETQINNFYNQHKSEILSCYKALKKLNQVFEVRQYAAQSKKGFYLTGWIPEGNLKSFNNQLKKTKDVTCIIEEDDAIKKVTPPTRLKNPSFFKPFEMLVTMYGIPSYQEIDPTIFVGITYLIMFALMFGDIGQGFVIALGGFILYKVKKSNIGRLALYLGIASTISGILYGSIFGNEHYLREVFGESYFLNPMDGENMILVLGGAIAFGVLILIISMVINLINALKQNDYGRFFFDKNGVVGLVFYLAIIYIVISFGSRIYVGITMSIVPAVILILISLIVIFLSHPLQKLIEGRDGVVPEDKVGFLVGSAFEVFEVVLGVLSNTLSFMRIGAFAMNHVGFSLAVQILADMAGGSSSIIVMILGNILIIALEGMIVVIQCMRLEYYEVFSRFFKGDGTEFKPYSIN